ncbi:MAG TPA: hypothetical protein VH583_10595 [Vicinamibacterales bacterium]|jgi:hypothetical protein
MKPPISFADACEPLERLLPGSTRRDLVNECASARTLGDALKRLRASFQANVFVVGDRRVGLERALNAWDRATRDEGFHVLNDWDGTSDRVNEDSIPMNVLDYVGRLRGSEASSPEVIGILLDYYFFHVLQLYALRAWDDDHPDANFDRLARLLSSLQGADGSGQPFVDDAETLLLIATSHFEPHERGYVHLLERVKTLNRESQVRVAMGHASSMGSHLRFGFEATYARDTVVMRDDNVADYPWLCYALRTVIDEYARQREDASTTAARTDRVVEALVNGLSADTRAFVGEPPASLATSEGDRLAFRERFERFRADLAGEFEAFRPVERAYSPLSFFFNFSHNIVKGMVVDALLRGEPWPLTFNDMLTGLPREDSRNVTRELLANTLMTYARLNPDRIRGQLMPVIVYDPLAGRQAFGTMVRRLSG